MLNAKAPEVCTLLQSNAFSAYAAIAAWRYSQFAAIYWRTYHVHEHSTYGRQHVTNDDELRNGISNTRCYDS